jgi:hypothetical protein
MPVRRSHRVHRVATALTALLVVAACGDDGVSPFQQRQVDRAQATWDAQRLTYYTVEARMSCFCPPPLGQWHELTVANDSIIALRRLEPGPGEPVANPEWFATVDEVFRRVRSWNGSMRGNRYEATFDEVTGLPLTVNLITSPNIADGGVGYYFRALKPGLVAGVRAR